MEAKYNVKIGKEEEALKPKKVLVYDIRVEMQKDKSGKEVGEKVILVCNHPDREKPIQISKVSYLKDKKMEVSGIWFKLDDKERIPFNSALASLLRFYNADIIEDLREKELETCLEDKDSRYLVIKAY